MKKVLILGLGIEGMDNVLFFKKFYKNIGVADRREDIKIKGVNLHLGEDYLSAIKDYDIIVKSPGIPLHKIKIKKGQTITSQSDIFLKKRSKDVIGVTGTKGKSTTCSIINDCLQRAGKKSHLVGNVGNPALSLIEDTGYFVYELSSFQLATVTASPHIAVLLNIYTDHLDNHRNFREYVEAKKKITAYQKKDDLFIYNEEDKEVKKIAETSKAKTVPFRTEITREGIGTPLDPVYIVAEQLGIKKEIVDQSIKNFAPLPHRMEFVGEVGGVKFYDDSSATIPEATIRAIKTLKNIGTLIIGGADKGSDYSLLTEEISKNKISNIILLKGGEKIKINPGPSVFSARDMRDVVEIAVRETKPGEKCLLSPGASSFLQFNNYKERGDLFKQYLNEKKS